MAITNIEIQGYRGFKEKTVIPFAIPNGKPGSGLTIMVGPNNGGKTSIIEAVHLFTDNTTSIPEDSRTIGCNVVNITINRNNNQEPLTIKSRGTNTSLVEMSENVNLGDIFTLSSKRSFSATFGANYEQDRMSYKGNVHDSDYRSDNGINDYFGTRLLNANNKRNRKKFNDCLKKVLNPVPEWSIDQNARGQYLKLSFSDNTSHGSSNSGDGYINIFNIIDALYDSTEDGTIFIDEPEVSLHPDIQKKLFKLLVEYSKNRQIVISTHSPYFINWKLITENSLLLRVKRSEKKGTIINTLSEDTKNKARALISDLHNVHTLSLEANEFFFLDDRVIIVEGQDDVICYPKILNTNASFFGWGAGGASNIPTILHILKDLGYSKVLAIFDGDQATLAKETQKTFPEYKIHTILPHDVRDKDIYNKKSINKLLEKVPDSLKNDKNVSDAIKAIKKELNQNKPGLFKSLSDDDVKPEYKDEKIKLQEVVTTYFDSPSSQCEAQGIALKTMQTNDRDAKRTTRQVLDDVAKNSQKLNYTEKHYGYLKFKPTEYTVSGIKKINTNRYYATIIKRNYTDDIWSECIQVTYRILINTETEKIKIKKVIVNINSLPVNRLWKKIEAVIH